MARAAKIERIRTHVLRYRLKPEEKFQSAFSTFHDRWACLVEVTCEGGLTGWGECLGPARANAATVADMAGLLVGRDALDIEPNWLLVYDQFRDQGQRGLTMTALSGIDIALWDIAGKHFGVPVNRLLGGAFRTSIPAYATGGFRPVERKRREAVVEEVSRYAAAGFTGMKIKIGFGIEDDAAVIGAVREAIGPDRALMIDANHGYDAVEAIRLGQRVAEFDIGWFEEPVVPEHLEAYRDVRARQPIPVAGGETWHGRTAFAEAIRLRAVDVLQPDVCGCGGFTELRKIVAMAETAGIRVVPHVWGTAVGMAAALQAISTLPPTPPRHEAREPWFEYDRTPHPYREELAGNPLTFADGRIGVPDGPGLGIEPDPQVLAAYAAE